MSAIDFSATEFEGGPPSQIIAAKNGGEIWQAGRPNGGDLGAAGIDLLVLAAVEFPRDAAPGFYSKSDADGVFPGVDVIVAPNRDDGGPFTPEQRAIAEGAAFDVATAVRLGKRVLVTCLQGRNRSGLVTARALTLLFGRSGDEAIARVQERRAGALVNPHFVDYLRAIR